MAGLVDISVGNNTVLYGSDATDYDTEITNVNNIGDVGTESNIIDVREYGKATMRKLVGSSNAGNIEVVVNTNPSDASYALLTAKAKSKETSAFKIEFLDSTKTMGHYVTFNAIVASNNMSTGFDEARTTTFTLAVDGEFSDLTANA